MMRWMLSALCVAVLGLGWGQGCVPESPKEQHKEAGGADATSASEASRPDAPRPSEPGASEGSREPAPEPRPPELPGEPGGSDAPAPKNPQCKPGDAVNRCEGQGACNAVRDCVDVSSANQAGMCIERQCVPTPATDAAVSDWSCYGKAPLPKTTKTAALTVQVTNFGRPETTVGAKVEVFDPAVDPGLKSPLASAVSTEPTANPDCPAPCASGSICILPDRCTPLGNPQGAKWGFATFPSLPVDRLLVLRISGKGLVPTHTYGHWIASAEAAKFKDRYLLSLPVVYEKYKESLHALVGKKWTAGDAVVLAQSVDCSYATIGAASFVAGFWPSLSVAAQHVLFQRPSGWADTSLRHTDNSGSFAALGVKPPGDGLLRITGAIRRNGQNHTYPGLGVRVVADAVTVVLMRPWYPTSP